MTRIGSDTPHAPLIGAELAVARERAGRSLDEFAARLRIRRAFLQALEEGRVADLPGGAYPVAFLRSYALALGLDADAVVRRFKAEAAGLDRPADLSFPAPLPQRGRPLGALMLLGLGLAVVAYAGWYHLSGEGRLPAEAVQPVPARLAQLVAPKPPKAAVAPGPEAAGGAAPTAAAPTAAAPTAAAPVTVASVAPTPGAAAPAGAPASAAAAPSVSAPSVSAPSVSAAAAPATAAPTAPPAAPPAAAPSSLAVAAATPAQPANASVPPGSAAAAVPTAAQDAALAAAPALAVLATADAWIQVRNADGGVVFSHLLHAGDSWPVPPGPALAMTTGNAGGTELVTNGIASPPLGAPGAVLRNIPLTPPPAPASSP
ncbi:MAG: helix-turn-helix domain-containing protein [Acetobacteraceae bacterium]